MSSYEFWDELGKIFNAVVAYQEKNLEFNKRFISPWIRLGNIFEKQDRNNEAMHAYERAIEIDEANPQNWFELGNIHFKMENHPDAVSAFNRAIELDAGFGWAHNNLGLTMATMGNTEKAVALYQRAIDLLQDARDKAVAWNRLGNAYRKLNQYEHALEAFHKADELDRENSGFRDSMDEVSAGPTLMAQIATQGANQAAQPVNISPIELIVAGGEAASVAAEQQAEDSAEAELAQVAASAEDAAEHQGAARAPISEPTQEQAGAENEQAAPSAVDALIQGDAAASESPNEAGVPGEHQAERDAGHVEETVTIVVPNSTETYTETLAIPPEDMEAAGTVLASAGEDVAVSEDVITSDSASAQDETPATQADADGGLVAADSLETNVGAAELDGAGAETMERFDPAPNSLADQLLEAEPEVLDVAQHVAYEAFLKDMNEPLGVIGDEGDTPEVELPGSPEPVAKLDESGELQIEMDTKNAHVWNELGNVYFNTAAYDDSIVAYSKAIELDRWFAWPYSNLALAYVQKRRFVEAILLYQRSIELFSSDKDKAISWNRLGNVYRRLNDYENAIAAYQRADALDPDNSTLSLQSRFSLLGNYAMEQKPSYVS